MLILCIDRNFLLSIPVQNYGTLENPRDCDQYIPDSEQINNEFSEHVEFLKTSFNLNEVEQNDLNRTLAFDHLPFGVGKK